MIVLFEGLQKQIVLKSEEVKGPNVNAPEVALEGFMRSNSITKEDLFKKKIDKGEFYFFKTKSKKLNTQDLLEELVPSILQKIQWKKSMRWNDFSLNWGRPLKSILAIFDKKKLTFAVTGCVAQAEGSQIKRRAPYVDLITGPQSYHRIPEILRDISIGKKVSPLLEFSPNEKFVAFVSKEKSDKNIRNSRKRFYQ